MVALPAAIPLYVSLLVTGGSLFIGTIAFPAGLHPSDCSIAHAPFPHSLPLEGKDSGGIHYYYSSTDDLGPKDRSIWLHESNLPIYLDQRHMYTPSRGCTYKQQLRRQNRHGKPEASVEPLVITSFNLYLGSSIFHHHSPLTVSKRESKIKNAFGLRHQKASQYCVIKFGNPAILA